MEQTFQPNVGRDLLRIHAIISRGISISLLNSRSLNLMKNEILAGYVSYTRTLADVIEAHHLLEDEMAFPYFRERITDLPFDILMEQHKLVMAELEKIREVLELIEAGNRGTETGKILEESLLRLKDIWHPHIGIEEYFLNTDQLEKLIPAEEHERLGEAYSQHSREHARPDYMVIPFLLFNLPREERQIMARTMPVIVTEQLVPLDWKSKWSCMKPFFLD
jgi:hypothetical protein